MADPVFWTLAAILVVLSALAVLWPLLRPRADVADAREDGAVAVFRDQLAEVERDRARGLLGDEEAEAAQIEISRRMAAALKARSAPASTRTPRAAILAAALVVPVLGGALYAVTGAPGTPAVPFAENREERSRIAALEADLARADADLAAAGDEIPPGLSVFRGQTLMALGRAPEAAEALAPVVAREDAPSGVVTLWIEASLAANGGALTPLIRAAVERALRLDPLNPAASFYLSYAAETAGDVDVARTILLRRLSLETQETAWAPSFLATANRLGARLELDAVTAKDVLGTAPEGLRPAETAGPTAEQVADADAMAPEDRDAMIRGMVDGLAARLADDPADPEGWVQLVRARLVLGDADAARAAAEAAAPHVQGDAEQAAALETLRAQIPE